MARYTRFIVHVLLCAILPGLSTDKARYFKSKSMREFLFSSYLESLQIVDDSFVHSKPRQSTPSSGSHMLTFHRKAVPETLEISRAAEVFQTTLQILKNRARKRFKRDATEMLSWDDVELIADLSQCPFSPNPIHCQQSHHDKYRSISGICNNRQNPLWGAANTPLARWLPAQYEDGEREPKGWNRGRLYNGFQLPPVFKVSKKILKSSCKVKDDEYSRMLVEWGQYIDHDITFTPQSTGNAVFMPGVDCLNTCKNVHPCFPIKTGQMRCGKQDCLPFFRSAPACLVNFRSDFRQSLQRQQMNGASSFIDASQVYGNTPKVRDILRDLPSDSGQLAINDQFQDPKGRSYLPFVPTVPSPCLQDPRDPHGKRVECFTAGDIRVSEGMALTVLHTLWVREHNQVAKELKYLNDHWSSETVYQETRKIIGAMHQIITMRDYLPKIIGQESFNHFIGPYRGYDPTVDPSVSNVFATAAFRFGHATISPILMRLNESFQEHESFPHLELHRTFFTPWRIIKEGGIEPTLRGLIGAAAGTVCADMFLTEEVTERLVILNVPKHMDLASLNLQRGRDHGLPGYNDWRLLFGLKPIKTLDDLKDIVRDPSVAKKVLNMYKHPDNIDVWLGGLIEKFKPDSRTGPLFSSLLGLQMKMIRDGDRFWWEADGMFTKWQKTELLKTSLARVICDNSDISEVPVDPFRFGKYPSDYVSCDCIPRINLEAWREPKPGVCSEHRKYLYEKKMN